MSKPFDPYLNGGVSKNPYHPKGKKVFAINFSDLGFKVDGKEVDKADVIGAFPHMKCLIKVKREDNEVVLNKRGEPETIAITGKIEIMGTPLTCNCSMSKFKKAKWWDTVLVGD